MVNLKNMNFSPSLSNDFSQFGLDWAGFDQNRNNFDCRGAFLAPLRQPFKTNRELRQRSVFSLFSKLKNLVTTRREVKKLSFFNVFWNEKFGENEVWSVEVPNWIKINWCDKLCWQLHNARPSSSTEGIIKQITVFSNAILRGTSFGSSFHGSQKNVKKLVLQPIFLILKSTPSLVPEVIEIQMSLIPLLLLLRSNRPLVLVKKKCCHQQKDRRLELLSWSFVAWSNKCYKLVALISIMNRLANKTCEQLELQPHLLFNHPWNVKLMTTLVQLC